MLLIAEDQMQPAREVPAHRAPITDASELQVLLFLIHQHDFGGLQARKPCSELRIQLVSGRCATHRQRAEPCFQLGVKLFLCPPWSFETLA